MAEKFVPRHSIGSEIRQKKDRSKFVDVFLDSNQPAAEGSRVEYRQIPLDEITPRCINKYRQSRIEQLAESIRNTNNRLIHPIVLVRACDLPESHEVRRALEAEGKNIADLKYIIVSGERRFHAWQLLREQEAERIRDFVGISNQFDTITANILTKTEALNERAFYADANNQARHISPAEAVWFIKDALKEVTDDEQKRQALIKMNQGSEDGIDPDPVKAARKFRVDNYCRLLLSQELGVSDWTDSTIRAMANVAVNCDDKIADALLSGTFVLREARAIASLDRDTQLRLLTLFAEDRSAYDSALREIKVSGGTKQQKVTHADTRRQLKATLKRLKTERDELDKLAKGLGAKQNRNELDAVRKYDIFLRELSELIENTR